MSADPERTQETPADVLRERPREADCGQARKRFDATRGIPTTRHAHSSMNKCESGERAIDIAELWAISNIYGKPLSHFAPDKM